MTDTKRTPVPRVPPMSAKSRDTSHLNGEFPFTENPKSGPVVKAENSHTKEKKMSTASKIKKIYTDNRETIHRKAIVFVGATAGLLLTAGISEHLKRKPQVIVIHDSDFDYSEPSESEVASLNID